MVTDTNGPRSAQARRRYVKVVRAADAYALAAQLETEQPCHIQVMAIFPRSAHLLEHVQAGLPGHVRFGWYQA